MSIAIVDFPTGTAVFILRDEKWVAEDDFLESELNGNLDRFAVSGGDPNKVRTFADLMAKEYGGKVRYTPPPPPFVEGRIY